MRILKVLVLAYIWALAVAPHAGAQQLDLDKIKKRGKQLIGKVPKKLDPSKQPQGLSFDFSVQLSAPPEPRGKQAVAFRASSTIGLGELRRIRSQLEATASPAVREQVARVREYVRKNGLAFEVGVTSVSGKPLSEITGMRAPDAQERASFAEQAALAEAAANEESEASAPRSEPMMRAAGNPLGQSYYVPSVDIVAADWMDVSPRHGTSAASF